MMILRTDRVVVLGKKETVPSSLGQPLAEPLKQGNVHACQAREMAWLVALFDLPGRRRLPIRVEKQTGDIGTQTQQLFEAVIGELSQGLGDCGDAGPCPPSTVPGS